MPPSRLPFLAAAALALAAAGCSSADSASTTTTTAGATGAVGGTLGAKADISTPTAGLTGAGASSAQPFLTRVFYEYSLANHGVTVNYSPAGSAVGITDLQSESVDFGQSEVPMGASDVAKAEGGTVLQIPVDLGGVAISYNVPGAPKDLHLNGTQIAGIYLGTITDWHDIDASIPAGTTIVPVHRADSSGPGYDLDQYLIDTATAWVSAIGTTTASKTWPKSNIGIGEQLNSGVATYVKQTPGAIGFVEYAYAEQNGFTDAELLNEAGDYVSPSTSSIAASGERASDLSSSNFNIVNEPGATTYPLANFSWTLLYERQSDTHTGTALGKLFDWISSTGQKYATALGYAPLPADVQAVAHRTLLQLEGPTGAELFAQ